MSLQSVIIQNAVSALLAALPDDLLPKAADGLLDIIEDAVERSATPYDDAVVKPLTRLIRASFSIPDNDPALSRKPGDPANLHEVLVDWDETTRWNGFGAQPGPVYGSDFASAIVANTGGTGSDLVIDVTSSLAAWSQDPASNRGWLFMPTGLQEVIDGVEAAISQSVR